MLPAYECANKDEFYSKLGAGIVRLDNLGKMCIRDRSMNKFQAQFQNAAIKGELNDFIHFYQMLDVLIIDDIQELAGKDKTQNAFFNIFNHLHLSNKQLVMTCLLYTSSVADFLRGNR